MDFKVLLSVFLLFFIIQENAAKFRISGGRGRGGSGRSSGGGSRIYSGGGNSRSSGGGSWWSSSSGNKGGGSSGGSIFSSKPRESSVPKSAPSSPGRVQFGTKPSAPKFEEPKRTINKAQNNNFNYKTTPSAPPLGGSFGAYYNGKGNGGYGGSVVTPKPYVPSSLLKPTRPPYPLGQPHGLHPIPQNTGALGSSIGASKYPQTSSHSGSSPYNPYYNPYAGSSIGASKYPQTSSHSGSSPYNPYYNPSTGSSLNKYPQTSSQYGINPYNRQYNPNTAGYHPASYSSPGSYSPGTHSYPGSYGYQGHSPYSSAPYPQQAGYPVNSGGYHPSYPSRGSFLSQPGVVYVPTVVSSSRGTGDIFKEALIHSTVNAGVNAATNRIFYPSHFSGPSYGSSYGSGGYGSGGHGSGSGYDHTHITHNNYYYNQPSSVPKGADSVNSFDAGTSTLHPDNSGSGVAPSGYNEGPNNQATGGNQPSREYHPSANNNGNTLSGTSTNNEPYNNNSNVSNPDLNNLNESQTNNAYPSNIPPSRQPQLMISDEELRSLTEDLFSRQEFDANNFIKLNLQMKVNSTNITDDSPEPLFVVQPEAIAISTIELIRTLYDNYEYNNVIKEKMSPEKAKEQNDFLEVILQTNVMSRLMKWMIEKNIIAPDSLSMKEVLTRIWFTTIEGSTSAFERTFMAEKYWDTSIMGLQNWVYFNYAESKKDVNYMGYMDKLDLGDKGSLLKVVFKSNEIIQPTTVFIGTLPELEMALYTVCFYARPNEMCPVSLGGSKFNIFTHTYHSWGKDFLDLAVPVL